MNHWAQSVQVEKSSYTNRISPPPMPKSQSFTRKRKRIPRSVVDQNEPDPYTDDDTNGAIYGNPPVHVLQSIQFWEYARESKLVRKLIEEFRLEFRDTIDKSRKDKYNFSLPERLHSPQINFIFPFKLNSLLTDSAFPNEPFHKSKTFKEVIKTEKSIAFLQMVEQWPCSGVDRLTPPSSQSSAIHLDFHEDTPKCITYRGKGRICFDAPAIQVDLPFGYCEGKPVTHLLIAFQSTLSNELKFRELDEYVCGEDELYLKEPLIIGQGALVACPGVVDRDTGTLNPNFTLFPEWYDDGCDLSGVYKIFVLPWTAAVLNARRGYLSLNAQPAPKDFPILSQVKLDLQRDIRALFALRLCRNSTKEWPSCIRYNQTSQPLSPYLASARQISDESEKAISAAQRLFPRAFELMGTSRKIRMTAPRSQMPIFYYE